MSQFNVRETKCNVRTMKVFTMYVHKKMSMNEISKQLNTSRVTVRKDLERMSKVSPSIKNQIDERMKMQNEFSPRAVNKKVKPVMISFDEELLKRVDEHWKEIGSNGRSDYLMNLIKANLDKRR